MRMAVRVTNHSADEKGGTEMKVRKGWIPAMILALSLAGCGKSQTPENAQTSEPAVSDTTGAEESASPVSSGFYELAEEKETLIRDYVGAFEQKTYEDSESGLSITYNLCLPEGYDTSASYPMVVFIADSSTVGSDPTVSLSQGRGALVWASGAWQRRYPTIVAVPTYPETILDDHNGYTTTEYVELTKRFIDSLSQEYAVDQKRIYGTGQSMGCMTTLILASEYPDLFAACMFVDGQWDSSALKGLEGETFVYFAAEDDTSAWNGMQEVMTMFENDGTSYKYAQWDGTWSSEQLTSAAEKLFQPEETRYFISWSSGTIEAQSGSMGGGNRPSFGGEAMAEKEGNRGPKGTGEIGGMAGNGGSVSYHMASFDYAYRCIAVMEWLFANHG